MVFNATDAPHPLLDSSHGTDAGQHFGHQTRLGHLDLRHLATSCPARCDGAGVLLSGLLDACTSLDLVIEHPYAIPKPMKFYSNSTPIRIKNVLDPQEWNAILMAAALLG